ncbi:MAG TPA: hypothetical protein VFW71_11225 [Actinomycetota bacterium]|nr:hypothetical protein [Actinomycetota bacterium]
MIAAEQVTERPHRPGRTQVGPPPHVATAVAALAVTATGLVSLATGSASPFALPRTVSGHHAAEVLAAICLIVAATGLAFGSAVISARLQFLAPNAPGPVIAGVGGLVGSGLLAVSGGLLWVLSTAGGAGQPLRHALGAGAFALGGPAAAAVIGVSVLGLAVTSWFLHNGPRWLGLAGMVLAAADVAVMALVLATAGATLAPVAGVAVAVSLAYLAVTSALLPRSRGPRPTG